MEISKIIKISGVISAIAITVGLTGSRAEAKPEFAVKEKVNCLYCHVKPGGDRNFRGLYYHAHKHSFAEFDNEYEAKAAGVDPKSDGPDAVATVSDYPDIKVPDTLNYVMKDIDGKPVNLARYQGKVILLMNVASKCGNTPQYADMEKLYDKYKSKGLVILGFPANEFGKQEPGTEKEIKEFCTLTYGVKFPMFSKIVVKGEGQHPLYKFLTDKKTNPKYGGDIQWNFDKFLINRKGEIVARIEPRTKPTNDDVVAQIEKLLEEPSPNDKTLVK